MTDKPDSNTKKGLSKIKWIVIALSFLLVTGTSVGLGFKYLRKGSAVKPPAVKEQVLSTVSLDPFLVNLADRDGIRYVKATFRFGFADAKAGEELGKNPVFVAAARDAVISLLSGKTAEQILTPEGKVKLREEILKKIGELGSGAKVKEVYIVDFVVQL